MNRFKYPQEIFMKKAQLKFAICLAFFCCAGSASAGDYLGQLSANPYTENSTSGIGATNYRIKEAMKNKYTSGGPKLYNSDGEFQGNLNANRYDPDSISNPYGTYGSKYSSDSINNPYGAGSKYESDSPNNPYGTGWAIIDD